MIVVMAMVAARTMDVRLAVVMTVRGRGRAHDMIVVVIVVCAPGAVHVLHGDPLAWLGGRIVVHPTSFPIFFGSDMGTSYAG